MLLYGPVSLPYVDGFLIYVVMLVCLLVQEVEEVLDSWRNRGPRTQDAAEEIVDKLLQRAL